MSEPDDDVFPRAAQRAEPTRIPRWKLEEMAGNPAPPEGWRGSAAPMLPGADGNHVRTLSAIQDELRRPIPWPIRFFRALGRMLRLLFKAVAVLAAGALLCGFLLYFHGDLKPSAFLGAPAPTPATVAPVPLIYHTVPDPTKVSAPAAAPAGPAPTPTPRAAMDHPTPGREESSAPLGRPAPVVAKSGSYAFTVTGKDKRPAAYDPCRPIHYVTRAANSPAAGPQLIKEAIAAVSQATGLVFINDGATTEAPAPQHKSYQPGRYGDRWAPVLIAWETTAEEPRFTNYAVGTNVMGLGGSAAVSREGSEVTYVSGQLELNGPALQSLIFREGPAQARAVIEHELGHVVGLDHVQDPTQLMNPRGVPGVTTYQAGDLTGLARLGRGECRPGI